MKYYITTDIHGFYDEFISSLKEKGFFNDTTPHKLIICGDLFDRGKQALELQDFVLGLLNKKEIILIKGNHEDLAIDLLDDWANQSYLKRHHYTNGTLDTVLQLTNQTYNDLDNNPNIIGEKFLESPYIKTIIPSMLNYYETKNYIFVHGWIPCTKIKISSIYNEYVYIKDWRNADKKAWESARWLNGIEVAHSEIIEQNKTIICGHWHTSFGHAHYEGKGGEFNNNPDFSPYYEKGIIALDACTAFSRKVNCIILEDEN